MYKGNNNVQDNHLHAQREQFCTRKGTKHKGNGYIQRKLVCTREKTKHKGNNYVQGKQQWTRETTIYKTETVLYMGDN